MILKLENRMCLSDLILRRQVASRFQRNQCGFEARSYITEACNLHVALIPNDSCLR